MKKLQFSVILLFFLPNFAFAQKVISVSDFFKEISAHFEKYELSHTTVQYNPVQDSIFLLNLNTQPLHFDPEIELNNVKFIIPDIVIFKNLTFNNRLLIVNCTFPLLHFYQCKFNKGAIIVDCILAGILAQKCLFSLGLSVHYNNINGEIEFIDCLFENSGKNKLSVNTDNEFLNPSEIRIFKNYPGLQKLTLKNCSFKNISKNPGLTLLDLSESDFGSIRFEKISFDIIITLKNSHIQNDLFIRDCHFSQSIELNGLVFNEENFICLWEQFSNGKIQALLEIKKSATGSYPSLITWSTIKKSEWNLVNQYYPIFKGLYTKLTRSYRKQRDFVSLSACVKESRNLDNDYNLLQLKSTPLTFKEKLGISLKIFTEPIYEITSDYGTNPLKTAYSSIWLILLFAFIYFLLPFTQIPGKEKKFFPPLEVLALFFTTSKSLKQLIYEYKTLKTEDFSKEDFSDFVQANPKQIPFYLRIFSFSINKTLNPIKRFVYYVIFKFLSLLDGKWNTLSSFKKVFKSFSVFIILVLYLLYFLTKRFIYSLLQSINAFISMGFGKIKMKGVFLFLAIIEGIAGWVLILVFVIGLLFQMLS